MSHALIIDEIMIMSSAIQSRLEPPGLTSFAHSWAKRRAVAVAGWDAPGSILTGVGVEDGSALGAAQRISGKLAVPALTVTGDPHRARRRIDIACVFAGPFLLNQIEEAIALAQVETGTRATRSEPGFCDHRERQTWVGVAMNLGKRIG